MLRIKSFQKRSSGSYQGIANECSTQTKPSPVPSYHRYHRYTKILPKKSQLQLYSPSPKPQHRSINSTKFVFLDQYSLIKSALQKLVSIQPLTLNQKETEAVNKMVGLPFQASQCKYFSIRELFSFYLEFMKQKQLRRTKYSSVEIIQAFIRFITKLPKGPGTLEPMTPNQTQTHISIQTHRKQLSSEDKRHISRIFKKCIFHEQSHSTKYALTNLYTEMYNHQEAIPYHDELIKSLATTAKSKRKKANHISDLVYPNCEEKGNKRSTGEISQEIMQLLRETKKIIDQEE